MVYGGTPPIEEGRCGGSVALGLSFSVFWGHRRVHECTLEVSKARGPKPIGQNSMAPSFKTWSERG